MFQKSPKLLLTHLHHHHHPLVLPINLDVDMTINAYSKATSVMVSGIAQISLMKNIVSQQKVGLLFRMHTFRITLHDIILHF